MHAAYLRDRIGCKNKSVGGKIVTPHEILHGYAPRVDLIRVFGCNAWGLIPKKRRNTWSARSIRGTYVGESTKSDCRLIYDHRSKSILETPHVVFDEKRFGSSKRIPWQHEFIKPAPPSHETATFGPTSDRSGADPGNGDNDNSKSAPPLIRMWVTYTTERENETPRNIAKRFDVDVHDLIEHNDWSARGHILTGKSRFVKGTDVYIPVYDTQKKTAKGHGKEPVPKGRLKVI